MLIFSVDSSAQLVRPRNKLKIRNNLSDARAVRPYNLGFCNTLLLISV